jgi:hypothetical protein
MALEIHAGQPVSPSHAACGHPDLNAFSPRMQGGDFFGMAFYTLVAAITCW